MGDQALGRGVQLGAAVAARGQGDRLVGQGLVVPAHAQLVALFRPGADRQSVAVVHDLVGLAVHALGNVQGDHALGGTPLARYAGRVDHVKQ